MQKDEIKKAVVIGGSGFMGSHVADELSNRGYGVTIYDKKESPWLREDQTMFLGDVLDLEQLRQAIDDSDCVFHFAGEADIEASRKNPYGSIESNIMSTLGILESIKDSKINRFVYASTMYVYSPFGSFYRASKQASEILIEAYNEEYDINFNLLRFGSLYGPRAQAWNGLKKYVQEIVKEGQLNYPGNGNELREYIHVYDAARLSVDILDEKYINQAITLTGNQSMTSKEIVNMIFEISGMKANINFESEMSNYHYSLTPYRYTPKKAKKLVPNEYIDIGQGILNLIEETKLNIDN